MRLKEFWSSEFNQTVYCGQLSTVIVPADTSGPRGGTRRSYSVYTGDQRTLLRSECRTLGEALRVDGNSSTEIARESK